MAPDVLVLMSIGGVSFIASYLTLLAQLPGPPEQPPPEGPEVTYSDPPPLRLRWAEPLGAPQPAGRRRAKPAAPLAPPRVVLELDGAGWHLTLEPLADVAALAVHLPTGGAVRVHDLRWTGAVALPGPRPRRRVRVEPMKA